MHPMLPRAFSTADIYLRILALIGDLTNQSSEKTNGPNIFFVIPSVLYYLMAIVWTGIKIFHLSPLKDILNKPSYFMIS